MYRIHITNLEILEKKHFCFTKLLNKDRKESNMIKKLDIDINIINNNNKYLPNLPDS